MCVCLCQCVCTYACIYPCIHVHLHACTCWCVCVCLCLHICVLVHVCTSACVFLLVIRFGISSLRLRSPTSTIFSASFYVFQFHVSQSARYLEKIPGLILLEVTVYREGHIKSVTEKWIQWLGLPYRYLFSVLHFWWTLCYRFNLDVPQACFLTLN